MDICDVCLFENSNEFKKEHKIKKEQRLFKYFVQSFGH